MRKLDYEILDNIPLGEMELSTRLQTMLEKHGVLTGTDVMNLIPRQVKGWYGIGRRSINELLDIQEWLRGEVDRAHKARAQDETAEIISNDQFLEDIQDLRAAIKKIETLLSFRKDLSVEKVDGRLVIIKKFN